MQRGVRQVLVKELWMWISATKNNVDKRVVTEIHLYEPCKYNFSFFHVLQNKVSNNVATADRRIWASYGVKQSPLGGWCKHRLCAGEWGLCLHSGRTTVDFVRPVATIAAIITPLRCHDTPAVATCELATDVTTGHCGVTQTYREIPDHKIQLLRIKCQSIIIMSRMW